LAAIFFELFSPNLRLYSCKQKLAAPKFGDASMRTIYQSVSFVVRLRSYCIMNYRKLFVLSISSLSIVAPAFADTQTGSIESPVTQTKIPEKTGGPGGKGKCGAHHRGMKGGLDLTDAQKEKLFTMKNSLKDAIGPKKLELSKNSRELRDLLTKPSIDRAAIKTTQSKINDLKADIANLMIAFKADFAETLTPEQRQKMRFARSFKGGHHKHFKHGGPGRGPRPTAEMSAPAAPVS
jgi:Spy/CpxP family protein refolding chaperone